MKNTKALVLTFAEKCKNILASNWQGYLNTIKTDAKGSKEDIYTSKVKYLFKKGKPYIWVPENDLHNVNTIIDERGSLAVTSPIPGPLANLMRSVRKLPARVALTGDVVPLKDEKVELATESLRKTILSELEVVRHASYAVSGVLSSSSISSKSRSENLLEVLDGGEPYMVYKFNVRSCTYIDGNGGTHEVDLEDIDASKADTLSPFSEKLIDGINQSQARRRALMLFCFVYLNVNARDAFMLSVDRRGFDVLGKVPSLVTKDGFGGFQWKELRFTFKDEARDIETFCRLLVEMEEEALKNVKSYSGLG
ncbi:PREDICTED: uncharacterized protein LOC104594565 [Nelumbo nucifera]|uniref:Uncharacterized protein LOC104594565 n=2 Tax=Nelumbo nucifera TaxID=4432 RepID=A0A1U7ZJB6_NELNU|nr:PREDICTED: uncharacterized protein LOC104594565 [Nelumbo nucifera]XP_010253204.1 PREDICTED: uncharacterized protein LOC104594565 [Nelumbo nucifera]DAD25858.1 TPA_asm: hypothetical protein HUJ06_027326 [Nelumbo nucifera]